MKSLFTQRLSLYIFCLVLFFAACAPHEYLNPPYEPYNLFFIPPQVNFKTEYFSFQPPLSRDWGLWTNIGRRTAVINKTKITLCHRKAKIWLIVLYLGLKADQSFENQRKLINAFISGEKKYLAGEMDAPITETYLHQGFEGIERPLAPKTEKINNTYFKLLKWNTRAVDTQEPFTLNLYITPARDLRGIYAIAVVSSKESRLTYGTIRKDIEMVVGSFEALK